jgi:glucose/arabinose dehydrogenase
MQSFSLHPQFAEQGAPGYGKIYAWVDVMPEGATDFQPGGGQHTNDNVMVELSARNASAATYDGGPARELFRIEDPFQNHNGGRTAFNPLARPGDPDYGLLYQGVADGGSGGDPLNNAQNLGSIFGKILRIDPVGRNSSNGKYGIPASNPFAGDDNPQTLGEVYAYGVRNPQNFAWDRRNGRMFTSDIGQNTVEEVSVVTAGANLGWNVWEGSYRFVSREGVSTENPRSDPKVTYPIVEFAQVDPLFGSPQVAATGLAVYRDGPIQALRDKVLFGDLPSGEMFYVSADDLPRGGQTPIRRILLNDGGQPKRLLELIQAKNRAQGKNPVNRADLRFHTGNDARVFVLNKGDGVIRVLTP